MDDVELIEFHDGVIERIDIRPEGRVCIEFSHLAVYRRETPNTLGIWSFRAELQLVGIKSFSGEGIMSLDARPPLEDVDMICADDSPLESAALARGGGFALGSIELIWALSGARIAFRGGILSLTLLEPLRRVETWTGDLK